MDRANDQALVADGDDDAAKGDGIIGFDEVFLAESHLSLASFLMSGRRWKVVVFGLTKGGSKTGGPG